MSQQKPPLIAKISSSLSTAIFYCRIYSNWQINVHLMSTVKLNLVKIRSTPAHKPSVHYTHSNNILSHTVVADTCLKDIHKQNMR